MKLADEVKNLDDAMQYIIDNISPENLTEFASGSEDSIHGYHFGFGMSMRNGFGLWGDSDLAKWFKSNGILHADDMSGIILTSLHRKVNNKPIELNKQINSYRVFWKGQGINPDTMERDNGRP